MASKSGIALNNRKPFKLLARLDDDERAQIRCELEKQIAETPGKLYPRMLCYFDRCVAALDSGKSVSLADFVKGTDLPASPNAFDKFTSVVYNFLQKFLAHHQLDQDPVAMQQLAFRAYRDRPFDWKEIRRRHGEAQRELDKLPQSSQLSNERLILDLDLAVLASDRLIPPDERGYADLLVSLEANYVVQKLRLLCAIVNDRKIFEAPTPDLAIRATLPPMREGWSPLARMYYGVYQLLTGEEDEQSMQTLRRLLDDQDVNSPSYPKQDMLDLYGYLLNAFARKVNQGDVPSMHNLSYLHDHLIDKGILLENGMIAAEHFKNVISLKLKTGEIDSARRLFEQLRDKISNDPERNAVRYNHTLILFAENHLEKAAYELEDLCGQTGNLKLDLFYGLDMRTNLLKIYFDLLCKTEANPFLWDKTDEKMVRLLESFRGYIERRKISESRRMGYESFRKLMQSLYDYVFRYDPSVKGKDFEELERETIESGNATDRWFISRLEEASRKRKEL